VLAVGSRVIRPGVVVGVEAGLGATAAGIGSAIGLGVFPLSTASDDTLTKDPWISLYHGTDVPSAVSLLAGAPLSLTVALEKRNFPTADLGFYLATVPGDAHDFGARAGGLQGYTVLAFSLSQRALAGLQATGAQLRSIPGPTRYQGLEFFIPPSAFPTFNALRLQGQILLVPGPYD